MNNIVLKILFYLSFSAAIPFLAVAVIILIPIMLIIERFPPSNIDIYRKHIEYDEGHLV